MEIRVGIKSGVGVVMLYCDEFFLRDFGSTSGDHTKTTNHNLFVSFKKSHTMSNICTRNSGGALPLIFSYTCVLGPIY